MKYFNDYQIEKLQRQVNDLLEKQDDLESQIANVYSKHKELQDYVALTRAIDQDMVDAKFEEFKAELSGEKV